MKLASGAIKATEILVGHGGGQVMIVIPPELAAGPVTISPEMALAIAETLVRSAAAAKQFAQREASAN